MAIPAGVEVAGLGCCESTDRFRPGRLPSRGGPGMLEPPGRARGPPSSGPTIPIGTQGSTRENDDEARLSAPLAGRPHPFAAGDTRPVAPVAILDEGDGRLDHHPQGILRVQHRRRLLPGELPAVEGLLGEARGASRTGSRSSASAITEEGRPQLAAIVTSPANHRRLDRYRQIARRLALAEGVDRDEARRLAAEGKAVVWIDAGLHATEMLCAQALIETVYQFLAANDEETLRILDDVIILFVHANPDGQDLVADWYMRETEPDEAHRWPACRGSTRSTSATTTTATSTPTPRPRRRT